MPEFLYTKLHQGQIKAIFIFLILILNYNLLENLRYKQFRALMIHFVVKKPVNWKKGACVKKA